MLSSKIIPMNVLRKMIIVINKYMHDSGIITSHMPNYAILLARGWKLELRQEYQFWFRLATGNLSSEELLKEIFRRRCAEREIKNSNTFLSASALPEAVCNALYWRIAIILFAPKNLNEMISILFPKVKYLLEIEYHLPQKKARITDVEIKFKKNSLENGSQFPITGPADLTKFIIKDEVIFSIAQLEEMPFSLHMQVYDQLSQDYPALKETLYSWNETFIQLAIDIDMVKQNGKRPKEVIEQLIKTLTLMGEKYTGSQFAPYEATYAVERFIHYINSLPKELKIVIEQLKKSSSEKNIESVIKDLINRECIETAASDLESVLQNSDNQVVLNQLPNLTETDLKKIRAKYGAEKPLLLVGKDSTKNIPEYLKEQLFSSIHIRSVKDYISLFINFHENEYATILKYADIQCKPPLPSGLAEALAKGLLSNNLLKSFLKSVFTLRYKFGSELELFHFVIKSGLVAFNLAKEYFQENIYTLLYAKDRDDYTSFDYAIKNGDPELFKTMFALIPEEEKLEVIDKYYLLDSTIHSSNASVMKILLELYSPGQRLAILNETNISWFYTVLFYSENSLLVTTILSLLPPESILELINQKITYENFENISLLSQIIMADYFKYDDGEDDNSELSVQLKAIANFISRQDFLAAIKQREVLDFILNKKPARLGVILESLTEEEDRLELFQQKDSQGLTMLHSAIKFFQFDTIKLMLQSLSEENQIRVLLEKDNNGKTVLKHAINEKFAAVRMIFASLPEKNHLMLLGKEDGNVREAVAAILSADKASEYKLPDSISAYLAYNSFGNFTSSSSSSSSSSYSTSMDVASSNVTANMSNQN